MTVGIGFDVHKLVKGKLLFLGGMRIPYSRGLAGHSDGDVVLHAVCDAILGAASKGDIGDWFPDTDPKYKDISSAILLSKIRDKIKNKWTIENIDINILGKTPKLGKIKSLIARKIAEICHIDSSCVNVKAKTMNTFGNIGKGKYIASCSIVSLKKRRQK